MSIRLDSPTAATNAMMSPVGSEHLNKNAKSFRGETVESSPAEQSQIKKTLRRQITNQQISKISLQRLINTRRAGEATDPEVATARIADFYDKVSARLPNFPKSARLAELLTELRVYHNDLKGLKSSEASDVEEEDEDDAEDGDDDKGVKGAEGRRRGGAYEKISKELSGFDTDVSHQSAAFDFLKQEFEDDESLDSDFRDALVEIESYFGQPDVRQAVLAGYASAIVANERAPTLKTDPAAVRDAYRQLVREEKDFARVFDALLQFDPLKNCDEVFETFILAAGSDLRSLTGASTDPEYLQVLMGELGKLKRLRTVLDGCAELARQVNSAVSVQSQSVWLQ